MTKLMLCICANKPEHRGTKVSFQRWFETFYLVSSSCSLTRHRGLVRVSYSEAPFALSEPTPSPSLCFVVERASNLSLTVQKSLLRCSHIQPDEINGSSRLPER